jgi:1-acyl-sn-glycerol-3-phosphate acyltransferase
MSVSDHEGPFVDPGNRFTSGGDLGGLIGPVIKITARRLPITPAAFKRLLPGRSTGFPWVAPSWPDSVERPAPERRLGVDYNSDWARRYPARLTRAMITEAVTKPLVRAIAAPEVTGLDRIAHLDEPVIFAANHTSHLDTPLLLSILPDRWRHRTVVGAASDYFFDKRWKAATFALTLNAVPIERTRVNRASGNRLGQLLGEGWSLLIYPEGGRSPDGWGQSHRAWTAWVAARTGRTLVPVYVEGTGQILPRHASRLKPGATKVTFGAPMRADGTKDARELAVALELSLAALADEQATDWWAARRRAALGMSPSLTGPDVGAWRRSWALPERHRSRDQRARRWPPI